jgi:hypothetical protein
MVAAVFSTTLSPQDEFALYHAEPSFDQTTCDIGVRRKPCVSIKVSTDNSDSAGEPYVGTVVLPGYDTTRNPPSCRTCVQLKPQAPWRDHPASVTVSSFEGTTYVIAVVLPTAATTVPSTR